MTERRIRRVLLGCALAIAGAIGLSAGAMVTEPGNSAGESAPSGLRVETATDDRASAPSAGSVSAEGAAAGDLDDFAFIRLDVDYTLSLAEDGTSRLRVVESFEAEFPDVDQNRGMRRSVPDSYNGQPLHPRVVSVTDEDGTPRPIEIEEDDGAFTMISRDDDFVHGAQVYVFTYDLENVTWRFGDTGADEFYWDVNGVDWPQTFGEITATVQVDPALAASLTGAAACYVGEQGADEPCDIDVSTTADGATATASATDVGPHETMTVSLAFAPGTFVLFDTGYLASPWGWWQAASFLLVLVALGAGIAIRLRALRDAPGRPVVIAEYEPPAGIDALTAAVLLGKTSKAIPAEVLEQAVAGSIRIEEGAPRRWSGAKLRAVLVDPSRADGDGAQLLEGLFGDGASPGEVFEFGSSDTRLSSVAQKILAWAGKHLVEIGVYRDVRPGTRTLPAIVMGLGLAGSVGFGIAALAGFVVPPVVVIPLVLAIAAAVAFVVLIAHRPLSGLGAEIRDHLAGLKEFIAWAEADRIRMLQSPLGAERVPVDTSDPAQMLKIYEPLLPYAVVFGQEKQWAERLAGLYGDGASPAWYGGAAAFNAAAFSAGIGSLSASAMASSSTSGGSAGGGSAGGGGGGGGGGGV